VYGAHQQSWLWQMSAHHWQDKSHIKHFRWQATSYDANLETISELIASAYITEASQGDEVVLTLMQSSMESLKRHE
jgi:hypothetical protein